MASGERTIAQKILDDIEKTFNDRNIARTITRNNVELNPWDDRPGKYPMVWIGRGVESPEGLEDSKGVIINLEIVIWIWVFNSKDPLRELERMIQAVDNAMLFDLQKNDVAIITELLVIDEPDFFETRAGTSIRYQVQYNYTAGSR